jgi:hypothetical protein
MFSIDTLARIRRKVDKATKRADAQQEEFYASRTPIWHEDGTVADKHVLGPNPLDDFAFVIRGDYSEIFPASVGATVADLVLPKPVATDPANAADAASTGAYVDYDTLDRASQAFYQRLAIHQATLTRLAPREARQEALAALAGAI